MQVRKYQELAAEDIRFDAPLADACFEDRNKFCQDVPSVRRARRVEGEGSLREGGDERKVQEG